MAGIGAGEGPPISPDKAPLVDAPSQFAQPEVVKQSADHQERNSPVSFQRESPSSVSLQREGPPSVSFQRESPPAQTAEQTQALKELETLLQSQQAHQPEPPAKPPTENVTEPVDEAPPETKTPEKESSKITIPKFFQKIWGIVTAPVRLVSNLLKGAWKWIVGK